MGKIINIFNIILVIIIVYVVVFIPKDQNEEKFLLISNPIYGLESTKVNNIINTTDQVQTKVIEEEIIEENDKQIDIVEEIPSESKEEVVVKEEKKDILMAYNGSMSGYSTSCTGCSNYTASGHKIVDNNIYYNDKEYNQVRILSGDKSLSFGTIVRVKNSKVADEFIGIVLDRGGSVGFEKTHMFDLLHKTSSDAKKYNVSYNTTFEILRYGF